MMQASEKGSPHVSFELFKKRMADKRNLNSSVEK